ncbi:MAG: zeta toxin family protein [Deltaproteobacteria bacterium]|nr:zeta toxin family protein [Deltaproteobacteria bacterium]
MRPDLLVIAGPNGSGKTTTTEALVQHEWSLGAEYINPDVIAEERFGGWNNPEAVLQAARWAAERRETLLMQGSGMAFETVFSAPDKLEFLRRAKERGYFIRLFFIGTTDPAINIRRVQQRVVEGGHDVPRNKIVSRYFGAMENLALSLAFVDRAYLLDNSIDENSIDGHTATLYARTQDGQLRKRYGEPPEWVDLAIQHLPRHPQFEQLP